MKKVKKQKIHFKKYQAYFNKKVSAVCAMTLLASTLLSPLATLANTSSYPIRISSVSGKLEPELEDKHVNVTLNYHLIKYDICCLDYVIVHELSHFIHPNHSKEFWTQVAKYYPNYKKVRKYLKNSS